MTNATTTRAARLAVWGRRLITVSSRIAAFFATRTSRFLIVLIFVAIALYISYRQVWQPIVATAPLPPGVTDRAPQLNADLLSSINGQRVERVETKRFTLPSAVLFETPTH